MAHRTTCRVIYGDTDRMGHTYYGNYFRWFEIGRAEWIRARGLLFTLDEVQSSFGRTGKMFAMEWDRLAPDLAAQDRFHRARGRRRQAGWRAGLRRRC